MSGKDHIVSHIPYKKVKMLLFPYHLFLRKKKKDKLHKMGRVV